MMFRRNIGSNGRLNLKKITSWHRSVDMISNYSKKVVKMIASGNQHKKLMEDYNDHPLSGNWKNHRELHLMPDWLLIYHLDDDVLVLTLSRTGTHSETLGV